MTQQPQYKNKKALEEKLSELNKMSFLNPLVSKTDINNLSDELDRVKEHDGYAIIAGACAETFVQTMQHGYATKLYDTIDQGAKVIENMTDLPVTMIARAGVQMAKPRSQPTETLPNGHIVPSYQGDMVNSTILKYREPQPVFLTTAYRVGEVTMQDIEETCAKHGGKKLYTASEAFHLGFEQAVSHGDPTSQTYQTYNHSGHMKWVGNRTNDPNGDHVMLMKQTKNPMGVKIGPDMDVEKLSAILENGKPDMLIFRMQAQSKQKLAPLLDFIADLDEQPVLCCDPMHGNTTEIMNKKTRAVDDIKQTSTEFIESCHERGLHPGAFMFEIAVADDAQECIGINVTEDDFATSAPAVCDPTLNTEQFRSVINRLARDLTQATANKNAVLDKQVNVMLAKNPS